MSLNPGLVNSAISSLVGSPVVAHHDAHGQQSHPIDMETFHKTALVAPHSAKPVAQSGQHAAHSMNVHVKTLTGKTATIPVKSNEPINNLKYKVAQQLNIPADQQRHVFGGYHLEDQLTLNDYGIQPNSTIHISFRIHGGALHVPKWDLDPPYDYDFTHIRDHGKHFTRGGETYHRPCGWMRYALKVNGKYGNDVWLGSTNAHGEWPVSYHGTGKNNAESIADTGYKLSKGKRFAYGVGIYSTPSVSIAESYATGFWHNGEQYKVIFQNRVNPTNLQKIPSVDYWVSPRDQDIRPYSLCIKKV